MSKEEIVIEVPSYSFNTERSHSYYEGEVLVLGVLDVLTDEFEETMRVRYD